MSASDYRYNARTHVGLRRKVNEDAVLALPEQDIWVVSDGMGGHEAGDFASRLITDTVASIPAGLKPADRMHALRDAIARAHQMILKEADARGRGARIPVADNTCQVLGKLQLRNVEISVTSVGLLRPFKAEL